MWSAKSENVKLHHAHEGGEEPITSRDRGGASNPLTVTLNEIELILSAVNGVLRGIRGLRLRQVNSAEPKSWNYDIEGSAAEMAVAKALDRFFPNDFQTDVWNLEVRATSRRDGSLIIRENDSSAKRYVLVISNVPKFHIIGWIWGHEAKQPEYWKAPNGRPGAYFVPQRILRPFSELFPSHRYQPTP